MRLVNPGDTLRYRDQTFTVGESIYVTETDYKGLYGTVREIRSGKDQLFPDAPPDIYCVFYPPINSEIEEMIVRRHTQINGKEIPISQICAEEVILNPTQLRPMKKCRIYQIKPQSKEFLFLPYKKIEEQGFAVPPSEAYTMVYDEPLATDDLDEIFYIFNCRHPQNYCGRSMSVSDLVELYDDNESIYYYCDTTCFIPVKIQTPLCKEVSKS